MDLRMLSAELMTTFIFTSAGRAFWISASSRCTASATATVFLPVCFCINSTMAGSRSAQPYISWGANPSLTLATSSRRTGRPWCAPTTVRRSWSMSVYRLGTRTKNSVSPRLTEPAGRFRFCPASTWLIWFRLRPYPASLVRSKYTLMRRCCPPYMSTAPTPGTRRKRSAMVLSVR